MSDRSRRPRPCPRPQAPRRGRGPLLALALALTAAAYAADPPADAEPAPPSHAAAPLLAAPAGGESVYRVGAADILGVEVFDNADLSGTFTVAADGTIVYPILGTVEVGARTVGEITEILTRMLEKDYLYNPIVSITIKEYRSKQVTVLGDVGRPGVYYLDRPTRLLELLSRAEVLTPEPGRIVRGQTARVVRRGAEAGPGEEPAARTAVLVDLIALLAEGREEANLYLQDGDVIYIERTPSVHVIGEVKKPGTFPFEEGMTVLKAISLAGGPTNRASTKGTVVKRIEQAKEVRNRVRMETELRPDDTVEVPLSFW